MIRNKEVFVIIKNDGELILGETKEEMDSIVRSSEASDIAYVFPHTQFLLKHMQKADKKAQDYDIMAAEKDEMQRRLGHMLNELGRKGARQ